MNYYSRDPRPSFGSPCVTTTFSSHHFPLADVSTHNRFISITCSRRKMPPIPEPPNLLHFDIDDEALLLLRSTANPRCYSSLDESSVSLLENGGSDETETASSSSSPLLRIWSSYYNALTLRPVLVKSGTALILMILADMSAQAVEHLRKAHHGEDAVDGPSIDWLRALRFGVFGLIGAPWTHYYYYWLDAVLPPTEQPWTWTTAGT